jgi:hypothetical protein
MKTAQYKNLLREHYDCELTKLRRKRIVKAKHDVAVTRTCFDLLRFSQSLSIFIYLMNDLRECS